MKTDEQIQRDVLEELKWEQSLNCLPQLDVLVHNGVVTICGNSSICSKKDLAENVALRVRGVIAIAEDMNVLLIEGTELPSWKIAENIVRALDYNTTIPNDRLSVKVNNGWVILEGEVDWNYQKEVAYNAAKYQIGVKGIHNMITLKG